MYRSGPRGCAPVCVLGYCAVSYTHLDVYKRQADQGGLAADPAEGPTGAAGAPVDKRRQRIPRKRVRRLVTVGPGDDIEDVLALSLIHI